MKIRDVRNIFIDHYLFVEVETDTGIVGLGESGAWGFLEASAAVVEKFKQYLIGQDPLKIEHHWQYMYRSFHFRGAAVMGALSAIDIALWDIAGKHHGVPVYELLGGPCRHKARVYYHVFGESTAELVAGCIEAKRQGFTAIGHLTPFLDLPRHRIAPAESYAKKIADAADRVRQYREAVGNDVDLCVEIHRRLGPEEAVILGREIEPYRPYFYEDPVRPDNFDTMEYVARKINIPIATGERLNTLQEFAMLLKRDAVRYVRVDVCIAGGITHSKKIAALAEAFDVKVVPHNPLGPVSTAACLQLAACIPNFALQEYPKGEDEPPKSAIVKRKLTLERGHLLIPTDPGIGMDLTEGAAEKFPYRFRGIQTMLAEDGSIVDQ